MCTHSIHTPSITGRYRALVVALLVGLALTAADLRAQTPLAQDQPNHGPFDLQAAIKPTGVPGHINLYIQNPQEKSFRILVRDVKGHTYYEGSEAASNLTLPLNFSLASSGNYIIDVSTSKVRLTQMFLVEPPQPKQIRLSADGLEPVWLKPVM